MVKKVNDKYNKVTAPCVRIDYSNSLSYPDYVFQQKSVNTARKPEAIIEVLLTQYPTLPFVRSKTGLFSVVSIFLVRHTR